MAIDEIVSQLGRETTRRTVVKTGAKLAYAAPLVAVTMKMSSVPALAASANGPCDTFRCGNGPCVDSSGCFCFETTDGQGQGTGEGLCLSDYPCATDLTCPDGKCPDGYTCTTNTCCGAIALCAPACVDGASAEIVGKSAGGRG